MSTDKEQKYSFNSRININHDPRRIANPKPEEDTKGCTSCKTKGLKRLLQGSAALLKAELGIDATDEATIIERKKLCMACEHYDFGVCGQCGCFCAAKVKLKSEKCPKGLW